MKPGSKVKTPCSFVRLEMLITSGPIVPEMASNWLVFPVVRFLSSYFVLIRVSDGSGSYVQPRSLARRHNGIKRMGRRSEHLVESARASHRGSPMRAQVARGDLAARISRC